MSQIIWTGEDGTYGVVAVPSRPQLGGIDLLCLLDLLRCAGRYELSAQGKHLRHGGPSPSFVHGCTAAGARIGTTTLPSGGLTIRSIKLANFSSAILFSSK